MSVKLKKFGNDANNRIMVRLDTDKLESIEKELGKQFRAQVGVLGVKSGRTSDKGESSEMSNADIGLIHEKGSPARNIARRSFLAMPLTTKMPGVIGKVGALLLKGIKTSNIENAYKQLGIIAVGIVQKAFPTSGYGTWEPSRDKSRKDKTIRLIKTKQLRDSISSRVVSK